MSFVRTMARPHMGAKPTHNLIPNIFCHFRHTSIPPDMNKVNKSFGLTIYTLKQIEEVWLS